jgi:hypothetical protein
MAYVSRRRAVPMLDEFGAPCESRVEARRYVAFLGASCSSIGLPSGSSIKICDPLVCFGVVHVMRHHVDLLGHDLDYQIAA